MIMDRVGVAEIGCEAESSQAGPPDWERTLAHASFFKDSRLVMCLRGRLANDSVHDNAITCPSPFCHGSLVPAMNFAS